MTMTLQEQAWQSGLVLFDDEWNTTNWPPLPGGWDNLLTAVVLNHPNTTATTTTNQTVLVLGQYDPTRNTIPNSTNSVHVLNLAEPKGDGEKDLA